ncbi:MAG: phenylacetate--CoA ligase family protein [Methylococcaceae bacterium]|nr:phenylacetate--CoA ligase family protein [Methylococcaceae bacterium]
MLIHRPAQALELLRDFTDTPLDDVLRRHLGEDPQMRGLELFRGVVEQVPAYSDFLASRDVNPEQITDFAAFQALPLIDKSNYMQVYRLPQRCRGGELTVCDRLAVSSGSTGVPTFWPRAMANELEIALRFEQVFRHGCDAHHKRTLAVVCFPLGNWVGGVFTASCCWHLALKGYPLTVATPGNQPGEIWRVVRELAPLFDQTVLLGYPPFVKDVIDGGVAEGIRWADHGGKMVFAGEVFSEQWRDLMAARVGAGRPCYDIASLYGTADGGVLGNETPLSIAIRRFLADRPAIARELFGESRLPTLVQYDPLSRFFELVDGTLVVSGDNGIPLVRYHIADRGGLKSHAEMMGFLSERGADLHAYGLAPDDRTPALPFVWVFGRADFTVSFYGANVFPENVVVGLEQPDTKGWVTGKFVMEVLSDPEGSECLRITVELAPEVAETAAMAATLAHAILAQLRRLNSEFANYVPAGRQQPVVELRPFGDPDYFPRGVKHRYTRKRS